MDSSIANNMRHPLRFFDEHWSQQSLLLVRTLHVQEGQKTKMLVVNCLPAWRWIAAPLSARPLRCTKNRYANWTTQCIVHVVAKTLFFISFPFLGNNPLNAYISPYTERSSQASSFSSSRIHRYSARCSVNKNSQRINYLFVIRGYIKTLMIMN